MVAVAAGVTLAASCTAWAAPSTGTKTPDTFWSSPQHDAHRNDTPRGFRPFLQRGRHLVPQCLGGRPAAAWLADHALSGSRTKRYRWRVSFTKPVGFFYGVAATSAGNAWPSGTDWFSP